MYFTSPFNTAYYDCKRKEMSCFYLFKKKNKGEFLASRHRLLCLGTNGF